MRDRILPITTKKIILLITTIIVIASLYGIYSIRNNRQLGRELYMSVNRMSVQSRSLADAIGDLQNAFANPDIENDRIYTHPFDSALMDVRSYFGYKDMPLFQDVRSGYASRFEKLWQQVANRDIDQLEKLFTKQADELSDLRDHLDNMTMCFVDFSERYNQMSEWERYFVSWKNEQRILNDKVRIP